MLWLRKIAFYVFLAVSIGAAVWAWFRLRESKAPESSVTEHIPSSALVVIETRQVHELVQQLTRQNLIWNSLLTEDLFASAQNGIQYLDSLTRSSEDLSPMLAGNPVFWSFVKENTRLEHLIQFKLKEQKDAETIALFFNRVFKLSASVSSFRAYEVSVSGKPWLAACVDGIVYFSSDLSLLQKSIGLPKAESLAENARFGELQKLNGRQTTQIYFNHRLSGLFNRQVLNHVSVFGLELELSAFTCTGYTIPDSSSFMLTLQQQPETTFKQLEKLPDHVAFISGVSTSKTESFFESNQALLPASVSERNERAWQAINDSAMYNMQQEIYEASGNVLLAGYWLHDQEEYLMQMETHDEEKTTHFLELISDSVFGVTPSRYFHIRDGFNRLFSFQHADHALNYACVSDGELILMSSKHMLNYYSECMAGSNTLGKNASFMAYAADNLFEPQQYLYYENYDLIKHSTFPRLINSVELNTGDDVLSQLSLSLNVRAQHLQMRLHATHKQEKETGEPTDKGVLWSYRSDSLVSSPVFLFTNHLTHEHELCFQDQENTLYLVSSTGKAIWKKKLNESIRSDIYTVDLFKNGKLQLLFNTDNYLHLIDRNGNYVQGYPVRLPQKATSAISVLDYDKTRDYRIFVACADKKLYNYSLYGIKTEGFTPLKTDDVVKLPVHYAKVGASDYLITADEGGKLYGFSRKGEGRIDFANKVTANLANLYVSVSNNLDNTKIVYLDDRNSLLNKISLSDKKEALKLGDDVTGFGSRFELLNDDKQMDLLLFGDGALYAYDLFSGKLLESFNPQAVYRDARLALTEQSQQVIAYDQAGEKLDFFDLTGKPLYSIGRVTNTPLVCELYKNGKTYLITVNGALINCRQLH